MTFLRLLSDFFCFSVSFWQYIYLSIYKNNVGDTSGGMVGLSGMSDNLCNCAVISKIKLEVIIA